MAEAVLKSHTSEKPKSHKSGAEGDKTPMIHPFEMTKMEVPAAFSELAEGASIRPSRAAIK